MTGISYCIALIEVIKIYMDFRTKKPSSYCLEPYSCQVQTYYKPFNIECKKYEGSIMLYGFIFNPRVVDLFINNYFNLFPINQTINKFSS